MNKIIVKNNLKTLKWDFNFDNEIYDYVDIFIGFVNETPVVEFKDLKFKYEIRQNENIKHYGIYPQPNMSYSISDQSYLITERLNLFADTNYELYLWIENDGKTSEEKIEFKTSIPPSPYKSWNWDGKSWVSPIPYPVDTEKYYYWNEDIKEWSVIL